MTQPSIDEATAEFITKLFQQVAQGIYAQLADKVATLEQSVESMEKQIATLVVGYGEQAVFMEALVAQIAFASNEARSQFYEDVKNGRKEMLEVMQNASKTILADTDPNIAAAVADVASTKLSNSDS
jgi:hypothetical protein